MRFQRSVVVTKIGQRVLRHDHSPRQLGHPGPAPVKVRGSSSKSRDASGRYASLLFPFMHGVGGSPVTTVSMPRRRRVVPTQHDVAPRARDTASRRVGGCAYACRIAHRPGSTPNKARIRAITHAVLLRNTSRRLVAMTSPLARHPQPLVGTRFPPPGVAVAHLASATPRRRPLDTPGGPSPSAPAPTLAVRRRQRSWATRSCRCPLPCPEVTHSYLRAHRHDVRRQRRRRHHAGAIQLARQRLDMLEIVTMERPSRLNEVVQFRHIVLCEDDPACRPVRFPVRVSHASCCTGTGSL